MHWYNLVELLPPIYRRIKEMSLCASDENTELKSVLATSDEILDNFFIQTCDGETIKYWESLLGIVLYGEETIQERRDAILLRLSNNQPITMPYVEQVMYNMFGAGNYEFRIDKENPYVIHFGVYETDFKRLDTFVRWFETVCPAHIQWYSEHVEKAESEFEIYAHAESGQWSYATAAFLTGTETVYFGTTESTLRTIEL
jgi:hypothetical protein